MMEMEVDQQTPEEVESRAERASELFGEAASEVDFSQEEATTPQPIDSTETQPQQEVEADPWAGIPSVLRDQINALSTKVADLDARELRLKQAEQRIGSLTNEFYAAKQAAAIAAKAPTAAEIDSAAKSKAKWVELKEEFPDWGDAIDERLAAERAEINQSVPDIQAIKAELEGKTGQTEERLLAKLAAAERKLEFTILTVRHPDTPLIINSPEFAKWVSTQPDRIRSIAASSNSADESSEVLDAFKKSNDYAVWARANTPRNKSVREISEARETRLRQSATVPGRNLAPQKSEADMTNEERRQLKANRLWSGG